MTAYTADVLASLGWVPRFTAEALVDAIHNPATVSVAGELLGVPLVVSEHALEWPVPVPESLVGPPKVAYWLVSPAGLDRLRRLATPDAGTGER